MVRKTEVQTLVERLKKLVLDAALLKTQHYKVRDKGKGAIQRKEKRPPIHLSVVTFEKVAFGTPSTEVVNLLLYITKNSSWHESFVCT